MFLMYFDALNQNLQHVQLHHPQILRKLREITENGKNHINESEKNISKNRKKRKRLEIMNSKKS